MHLAYILLPGTESGSKYRVVLVNCCEKVKYALLIKNF